MNKRTSPYARSGGEDQHRVTFLMPVDETNAVDAWGVPAGMPSRGAAIRSLVRKGLEAVRIETGAPAAEGP